MGTCGNCRTWRETFNVRIFGLGLRPFCAECIRWAHESGMDLELVTDADPRKPVEGTRPVWTGAFRRTFLGRAVA